MLLLLLRLGISKETSTRLLLLLRLSASKQTSTRRGLLLLLLRVAEQTPSCLLWLLLLCPGTKQSSTRSRLGRRGLAKQRHAAGSWLLLLLLLLLCRVLLGRRGIPEEASTLLLGLLGRSRSSKQGTRVLWLRRCAEERCS